MIQSCNITCHFLSMLYERELIFLINNQHTLFYCWFELRKCCTIISLFQSILFIPFRIIVQSIQFTLSIHRSTLINISTSIDWLIALSQYLYCVEGHNSFIQSETIQFQISNKRSLIHTSLSQIYIVDVICQFYNKSWQKSIEWSVKHQTHSQHNQMMNRLLRWYILSLYCLWINSSIILIVLWVENEERE
jgi:hypothetical protein